MNNSHLIDVQIGSRHGAVRILRQQPVAPTAGDDTFDLELPGKVIRCEKQTVLLSVMPYARLVLDAGAALRPATVSAEVLDEAGLDRVVAGLAHTQAFNAIGGFALRLTCDRNSFAQVVSAAEAAFASPGCCGKCGAGAASLIGSIQVGVATFDGTAWLWTTPVRAAIKARSGDDARYGVVDPASTLAVASDEAEDCDSEWWMKGFWSGRFTTCHGGCTVATEICACKTDKHGRRHTACDGWTTCWCS